MLLIISVCLCVSALCKVIATVSKVKALSSIAEYFFFQLFPSLTIFCTFSISYATGLHLLYATEQNTKNYALSTFAMVFGVSMCFLSVLVLEFGNQKGNEREKYGELKLKFKNNYATDCYISVSILFRMCLGFQMSFFSQSLYQSTIVLAIVMVFLFYSLSVLPFLEVFQSYRSNLIHFLELLVLVVCNYWNNFLMYVKPESKANMSDPPTFLYTVAIVCITVSSLCLVFEIYKWIRRAVERQRKSKITDENKNKITNSFA